jgi:hypothetical protein
MKAAAGKEVQGGFAACHCILLCYSKTHASPEKDRIPPQDREDRQVFTGYWIFYNRNGSVSFGTETREYFGTMPAEIARAVPESVINCIACMIFEAHRSGRREAYTYLKEFVLEKLEVPDWPLDPMPKLPRTTPPSLPPESP